MYWEKRKTKTGESYYCFIYWDHNERRNIRVKREEIPQDLSSDAEADKFCRLKESEHEAAKMRIERKLAWQSKFYDFSELLDIFEKAVKERAPNSWEGSLYYLKQYGLDFFLNEKQCNNLNNWPLYFEEFRGWLQTVKTGKNTKSNGLAFSSKNNVIGAVNIFLNVMAKAHKCEHLPKCEKFPRHLLNRRTEEHVIGEDEAKVIAKELKEVDETGLSSDFFTVLLGTGFRLGEGLGISLADFFPGAPPDTLYLKGALARHSLKCFGYIVLESQVFARKNPRLPTGRVPRKPLKGRKVIDGKASRLIPIIDRKVFNILARRYNEQTEQFEKGKFGKNKSDYLLFDGLTKSNVYRFMVEAYGRTSFETRTAHCARHTYATNLAGMTNADTGLTRLVLGHKDEETSLGYMHLFEQIKRKAKATEQIKTKIELVDECA